MSKNLDQIYIANPITTIGNNDLLYVVTTGTTDAAISGANFKAQFAPLTTKGDLYGFSTVNARLAVGGTNGQILQVNSAATLGLAWSTPTYPSVSGSAGKILRSDGTNNIYTTATFADTYAVSTLLYASASNVVGGLTTSNNGLLVTSSTGVPSILAGSGTTGNILQSNASAAPSWSTPTYPISSAAVGKIIISDGTNFVSSTSIWPNTVGSVGKVIISDGTSNVYSTVTFPNTSAASGSIIISDGTNFISSTSLWPNTVGTSGKIVISNGTTNVYSTPTFPNASASSGKFIRSDGTNWIASTPTLPTSAGTSGKILQSDGTNYIESTPTYPSASGTAGKILRSDGTNNVYTTSTFSDTYSASVLLYSNTANTVTGLATANNGLLVTSASGVPSILAGSGNTGNFLQSNAAAAPSWSSSTLIIGGNVTFSGAFTFTGTISGNTSVTFPTSGTLATTSQLSAYLKTVTPQTFTGSGTYTPTSGMAFCIVEVQAPGGGSGGSTGGAAAHASAGAGGGGGGYARKLFTSAQVGASATVTIGAVGTAGTTGGGNGGTGGTTSVALTGTGTLTISATGGVGGGGAGSTAALIALSTPGGGGVGSGGDFNCTGSAGTAGLSFGTTTLNLQGSGGRSYFGGGAIGFPDGSAGSAGTGGGNYGGGASGGSSTTANAAGAAGGSPLVYITEYIAV